MQPNRKLTSFKSQTMMEESASGAGSFRTGLERFQLRTVAIHRKPNEPFGFVLKGWLSFRGNG